MRYFLQKVKHPRFGSVYEVAKKSLFGTVTVVDSFYVDKGQAKEALRKYKNGRDK